jgi:hypothetical protein
MIDIMRHYSRYVPCIEKEITTTIDSTGESVNLVISFLHQILFGGDQLTCAHARSAMKNVTNTDNAASKLLGLLPVVEDWHAQLNLLDVRNLQFINNQN